MTPTTQEDLGSGVYIEWLHDQSLAIFTVTLVTRQAVDAWANKMIEISAAWSPDKPYLVMHDVSTIALTPYARERVLATASTNPKLHGRYALVIPSGAIGQHFMLFINRDFKSVDQRDVEGRFFTERRKALTWLEELLPET